MTPARCFATAFRQCCTNMACAPLFMAAIVLYAAYYCWPYMAQLPDHIHCAIVDADGTALSRRLVMEFRATPDLNVLQVTRDRAEAILAMKAGEVSAIVEIPARFAEDVAAAVPTAVTLTANGAYLVGGRMATAGASGPLKAAADKAVAAWLAEQGATAAKLALMESEAPGLVTVPAYNTISGYLNFAVPIVFVIVFQTLMCAGFGMLFNAWYMAKERPEVLDAALASPACLFAVQMTVFFLCLFWTLFIEGPVFYLQGINSFQNIPGTLGMCAAFSLAVSSLASLLALLLGPTHFVMQAVVLSALPCVFISGNLWPTQNIPLFFQALGALFPSTPGSYGIIRASQCGADAAEAAPYMAHLLLLALLYFLLACLVARHQARKVAAAQTASV
ncbi:ABC transporter permease [Desulfovibrio sp.]|uniref:ABC transporter permease n=1 Tax=Desulfovibrio sp. TaxID=885 RepID=UPI0023CFA019|nr:ABC transporter permease [Desulfovibrio sp.]MDE7241170.1 ABC transporter permease [Desulfovibrio sp.]